MIFVAKNNKTSNNEHKGARNRKAFRKGVSSVLFLEITLKYFSNNNTSFLMLFWNNPLLAQFKQFYASTVVALQATGCLHCLRGMTVDLLMM